MKKKLDQCNEFDEYCLLIEPNEENFKLIVFLKP